jgi:DNA-binding response OmpR family regulator/HPt (histidine-containing phosphotransfer) domain-containing protein
LCLKKTRLLLSFPALLQIIRHFQPLAHRLHDTIAGTVHNRSPKFSLNPRKGQVRNMISALETLAELNRVYSQQLPGRVAEINMHLNALTLAWDQRDMEQAHYGAHGLAGSAGLFGFASVGERARALEVLLKAMLPLTVFPGKDEWQQVLSAFAHMQVEAHYQLRMQTELAQESAPLAAPVPVRNAQLNLWLVSEGECGDLPELMRQAGHQVELWDSVTQVCAHHARLPAAMPAQSAAQSSAQSLTPSSPQSPLPDLLLYCEQEPSGPAELGQLRHHFGPDLPLLFISPRDDVLVRLAAYRAGANRYLHRPVASQRVLDIIAHLTMAAPREPYRVMLVDDDRMLLQAQSVILREAGMVVQAESDPLRALGIIEQFDPEVLLLDMAMPGCSGLELAVLLREQERFVALPILFLSVESDLGTQQRALDLAGDDYFVKPMLPERLVTITTQRARRARERKNLLDRLRAALDECAGAGGQGGRGEPPILAGDTV